MSESRPQILEMLTLLKELVAIESPSHDKAAVDRVGSVVAEKCRQSGAGVTIHPRSETGDLVEARFLPSTVMKDQQGGESILLLSHMDTVFPLGTLEKMPFYEKEGRVFGPGVADMKGGIVVALTALAEAGMNHSLRRPVTALFTPDEEIGSMSSRALIEKLAGESSLVLVLEPGMPDGALKIWRKGVGEFRVITRGRAAHAGGDHEKGRNAIEEMAHQVLAIQNLTTYPKGTTLNVGVIRGGIASNVVPDEAVMDVDLRVMQPGEAERITAAMYALKPVLEGTKIEISGGLNRPPMPDNEINRSAFEKVRSIVSKQGIELVASGTGGASDANFVAPLGIPVLDGMGPAGGEYHSEREYMIIDSLDQRVKILGAILREW